MNRRALTLGFAVAASLAGAFGCGGASVGPSVPEHDTPVPASEPRAELRMRVDLTPSQGCEESFDLALYENRGVDLVQWDGSTEACSGRVITVRYLPRRLPEGELLEAVRALSLKAEPVRGK